MLRWLTMVVLGLAMIGCDKPETKPPEGVDTEDLDLNVEMGTETSPEDINKPADSKTAPDMTPPETKKAPEAKAPEKKAPEAKAPAEKAPEKKAPAPAKKETPKK